MKHHRIFIFTFILIAYIFTGIIFILLFPDQQTASAQELQEDGGFSRVGVSFIGFIRTAIQVILWPAHAVVLLVN